MKNTLYRYNNSRGARSNPFQYSCLENPRTEEPGRLQSIGSHRSDLALTYIMIHALITEKQRYKCFWQPGVTDTIVSQQPSFYTNEGLYSFYDTQYYSHIHNTVLETLLHFFKKSLTCDDRLIHSLIMKERERKEGWGPNIV